MDCLDGGYWVGGLPARSAGDCPAASAIHVACMNCLQLVAMPQEEISRMDGWLAQELCCRFWWFESVNKV